VAARRLLLWTIVAGACGTAAIAIVALLALSFDRLTARILLTTTAVSVCALLAVPAGALLERARRALLARTSVVLTLTAFLLALILVWAHTSTWLAQTWGVAGTLALAAAQACAVESRRRNTDRALVRRLVAGSAVSGGLLACLGVVGILAKIEDGGYYRLLGAVAVVDVLLLVLVAVLRRSGGSIGRRHRLRVDGRIVESPGRDFAAAVANAIRDAERRGSKVRQIERV
jgi:hypothetical protein